MSNAGMSSARMWNVIKTPNVIKDAKILEKDPSHFTWQGRSIFSDLKHLKYLSSWDKSADLTMQWFVFNT
jgi:hypothetical protein